jgi:hypothetical protein
MTRDSRINRIDALFFVFFDCVEVKLKFVVALILSDWFVSRKVNNKCDRQVVENIFITCLTGIMH